MPDAGRTREPCVQKSVHSAHASNTGSAEQPAFPAQWFTAYSVLSSVSRASCHRRLARRFAKLDPSIGGSGPHAFARPQQRRSSGAEVRPSHPALHVRDDA